jgi:hypothetical protein
MAPHELKVCVVSGRPMQLNLAPACNTHAARSNIHAPRRDRSPAEIRSACAVTADAHTRHEMPPRSESEGKQSGSASATLRDAADHDAAPRALDGKTPELAEQIDGVKARLSELCTHEGELSSTIERRLAELDAAIARAKSEYEAEVAQATAVCAAFTDPATSQRDAVRAKVASAKSELEALVNAPVSSGRDPFEWLPDELIEKILGMLPLATLWSGDCERVCQRWARLMGSPVVKRCMQGGQMGGVRGRIDRAAGARGPHIGRVDACRGS